MMMMMITINMVAIDDDDENISYLSLLYRLPNQLQQQFIFGTCE